MGVFRMFAVNAAVVVLHPHLHFFHHLNHGTRGIAKNFLHYICANTEQPNLSPICPFRHIRVNIRRHVGALSQIIFGTFQLRANFNALRLYGRACAGELHCRQIKCSHKKAIAGLWHNRSIHRAWRNVLPPALCFRNQFVLRLRLEQNAWYKWGRGD